MLTAIGHIGGSLIAIMALGMIRFLLDAWESKKVEGKRLREVANKLGVSVDDLDDEAIAHRVIEYSSAKYKSELFRNRLSDLCGGIRTAWAWLWSIIQLLITVAVIWSTAKESIENAVYAWWAVGAYMLCWLTSIAFSLVCYFLTGRYPGEAAKSRKGLAEYLEQRKRRGVLLPSE